jgi:hypothetical protein
MANVMEREYMNDEGKQLGGAARIRKPLGFDRHSVSAGPVTARAVETGGRVQLAIDGLHQLVAQVDDALESFEAQLVPVLLASEAPPSANFAEPTAMCSVEQQVLNVTNRVYSIAARIESLRSRLCC